MHWVKCHTHEGHEQYVNLEGVTNMVSGENGTILFFGTLGVNADGAIKYGSTSTKETPAELFALPPCQVNDQAMAVVAKPRAKPAAKAGRPKRATA